MINQKIKDNAIQELNQIKRHYADDKEALEALSRSVISQYLIQIGDVDLVYVWVNTYGSPHAIAKIKERLNASNTSFS